MSWSRAYPLRFSHCDPAGIGYYPRLLELCDNAIEDWTGDALGVTRRELESTLQRGTPTVRLSVDFAAMCRHGDMLDVAIAVRGVGASSLDLLVMVSCGGEHRFAAEYTLALVDQARARATAWPDAWRARLEAV